MCWIEVGQLVRQAQAGDRVAFGELVVRFEGSVYAAALARVRQPQEAQELTQEVFVHAMRKIGQLRDPRCFAGWLRRITARMAINRLTRKRLPGAGSDALDSVAARQMEPYEAVERAEQRVAVRAALKRLKPIDLTALEAFYLKGQSLVEIADRFDVPLGTVKRRLFTARARFKAALESGAAKPRSQRELACA
jgi:RNA polymerase sigma-70 factor (ECF subfamily)